MQHLGTKYTLKQHKMPSVNRLLIITMNNPALIQTIREAVIGDRTIINTSFGEKPLVYADYTASGRSVKFLEQYIHDSVLPYYANTHTETSFTGAQSTALREQARQIIRQSINANDEDQIIFCGSGATAAVNKLIDILNMKLPADLDQQYQLQQTIPADQKPVVFIGPYEHHSNELPWRETIADVVRIPLNTEGKIDQEILTTQLKKYQDRPLKIGSFSAASNVTGIKSEVVTITALLHQYDAYSFWDYAAAAPYIAIDMNPVTEDDSHKDAVFISPHKFVGGPGTPGILVVKQWLLKNTVPASPGGGTVRYVTPDDHQYLENAERREEGGTPGIVESVRAGLVFKLQQEVGIDTIEQLELAFTERAIKRLKQIDNIEILGNDECDRLAIFSLRFKHGDEDLHYGFVVALLNDLFGIQARGGCSCAGPYGHELLGMSIAHSKALEAELSNGLMIMRPGWVRLNFNYFIDEETFEYLLDALELIATHGWRLLPFYSFNTDSGNWCFQNRKPVMVAEITETNIEELANNSAVGKIYNKPLSEMLKLAEKELTQVDRTEVRYTVDLPQSAEKLRWFALPQNIDLNSDARISA